MELFLYVFKKWQFNMDVHTFKTYSLSLFLCTPGYFIHNFAERAILLWNNAVKWSKAERKMETVSLFTFKYYPLSMQ